MRMRVIAAIGLLASLATACGANAGEPDLVRNPVPVSDLAGTSAPSAPPDLAGSVEPSASSTPVPASVAAASAVPEPGVSIPSPPSLATTVPSGPAAGGALAISTSVADCDRAEERAGDLILNLSTATGSSESPTSTPREPATVIEEFPHDPTAYTEGLTISQGVMYEGLGLKGKSEVRTVDLSTGAVIEATQISTDQFGEGIAVADGRLVQLTWCSGVGHVYDTARLDRLQEFDYPAEGWGLTFDGSQWIASDGSSTLWLLDRDTMQPTGSIEVTVGGQAVRNLNELEWVDGRILANIWALPDIAVIDPATGVVERWIDTTELRPATAVDIGAVANGIAWDADRRALYVTGKFWDKLYRIAWP